MTKDDLESTSLRIGEALNGNATPARQRAVAELADRLLEEVWRLRHEMGSCDCQAYGDERCPGADL